MSEYTTPSSEALFRYLLVSEVLGRIHAGEKRSAVVLSMAARDHRHFDGLSRRVSKRSIHRWITAYSAAGMAGLERKARSQATSCVLPKAFVAFLVLEKRSDEGASIPEVIRRARGLGILQPHQHVSRSTVHPGE